MQAIRSTARADKSFIYYPITLNWADARLQCMLSGGDLATIANSQEQLYIATGLSFSSAWIGLNDISRQGTFVWADGDVSSYRSWPSTGLSPSSGQEDCVQLTRGDQAFWDDHVCSNTQGFVCALCSGSPCTQVITTLSLCFLTCNFTTIRFI